MSQPDPYGAAELKNIIAELLWVRTYVRAVWAKYPQVFSSTDPSLKDCLIRFKSVCLTLEHRGHFLREETRREPRQEEQSEPREE